MTRSRRYILDALSPTPSDIVSRLRPTLPPSASRHSVPERGANRQPFIILSQKHSHLRLPPPDLPLSSSQEQTSQTWRSQQRRTLDPASPLRLCLPGGASSPALHSIPYLPASSFPSAAFAILSTSFLEPFLTTLHIRCVRHWAWH